jgi:hypothetical protein
MEVPRDRLKLRDNEKLLSPPFIVEPVYQCSKIVVVRGFIASATLDVRVNGSVVVNGVPGGFPEPEGAVIHLASPLTAGQKVQARQHFGGTSSGWSAPAHIRNHLEDYPAGPPRPVINPAPQYKCGMRTGVGNLLTGCTVWITAGGTEVGRVTGATQQQGVNVSPSYGFGQHVVTWADLCHDPSPPSAEQLTQAYPLPLPVPGFEPVYEGGRQVIITNLADGAHFTLYRDGIDQGTWATWGGRSIVGLNPPFAAGETLTAIQQLCPGDPPSSPGTIQTQPCSALPAPQVASIQDGDTSITLLGFVPDARIKVFANGVKVGDGGGPVIVLTRPIHHADTIDVLQIVGDCEGRTVQEIHAQCVAPPVTYDPSTRDVFPVGTKDYNGGTIQATSDGQTYAVKGSVYYPAQSDGSGIPFNQRLANVSPAPIVFLAHGNHDPSFPSYRGYDYFQQQLASMGIIAVSVDLNQTNGGTFGAGNIRTRAELIIASIEYFQSLNVGGDPIFGSHIDFAKVGLMGHSRGGEAVVVVPEIITLPGVSIRGVLSLAPTDFGASSGAPHGYAFMTILPAADGDVRDNDGAKFYDQATPDPFKSQLYVYYANHNYFNRQWLNDDTGGLLPIMVRSEHEHILSAYGCALFQNVLQSLPTTGFLSGTLLPAGVAAGNVHLSFALQTVTTVDDHAAHNWIGQNTLGQPTALLGGLIADEYGFGQTLPHLYNGTFYGKTIGMVASTPKVNGAFRSQLPGPINFTGGEIWLRCAEVFNGSSVPPNGTGFQLGLQDSHGIIAWVDSDDVGGLPRPFDRTSYDSLTKTMLKTLRFRSACFKSRSFHITQLQAIFLRLNRADQRAIAFDDLQIV